MGIARLYTIEEAIPLLGGDIKPSTLLKWCREGKIEAVYLSRKVVRIPEESLQRFIASSGSTPPSGEEEN